VLHVVKADGTLYRFVRHGLMQMNRMNESALVGFDAVLNPLEFGEANTGATANTAVKAAAISVVTAIPARQRATHKRRWLPRLRTRQREELA